MYILTGFPGGDRHKELHVNAGDLRHVLFDPWVRKIPWRRAQQPALVFLPGESHGQAPGGLQTLRESDAPEVT